MRKQTITLCILMLLTILSSRAVIETKSQRTEYKNTDKVEEVIPNRSTTQKTFNTNFKTSAIIGAKSELSVNIFWVGLNKSDVSEIGILNGTYDIQTGFAISPIQVRVNITGYSSFSFGNVALPNIANPVSLGNSSTTLGQAFLIINNEVLLLTMNEITQKNGFSIVLPLGDHTITVLYLTMEQNGTVNYASDNITVRLREIDENFEEYITISLPLIYQVTDIFNQKAISLTAVEEVHIQSDFNRYQRVFNLDHQNDIQIKLNLEQLNNTSEIFIGLDDTPSVLNLTGTVNSTGFSGIQLLGEWSASQGISFFTDVAGIHTRIPDVATIRKGLNYLGIITFSPYGFWHRNITYPDGSGLDGIQNGRADWDWVANKFITSDSDPNSQVIFDSSFDFQPFFTGIGVSVNFGEAETFTSKTKDSPTITIPSLIFSLYIILMIRSIKKKWGEK